MVWKVFKIGNNKVVKNAYNRANETVVNLYKSNKFKKNKSKK